MAHSRRQLLRGALAAAAASALPRPARAEARGNTHEHFELTETELFIPGLDPAHDGLRVAQLSDLHVYDSTPDGRVIAAVKAVNAARPDLVMLTGDYVTWSRKPIEHLPLVLGGLEAPVVGVLGNHDHYVDALAVKFQLQKLGYAMLQNQSTALRLRGAELHLVGVDDSGTGHADVRLAHNPPTANMLPEAAGLTCFSGHTHGGQINIPFVTRFALRLARQPYVRGHYEVNGNQLYVNRGLGFGAGSGMPRVNSDPEVALFTLRVGPELAS